MNPANPFERAGQTRFIRDAKEGEELRRLGRHEFCPHCLRRGSLIGHGKRYVYYQSNGKRQICGYRLICSKRRGRKGCGRTISVHLSDVLRRCLWQTQELWRFVQGLLEHLKPQTSYRRVLGFAAKATAYRLCERLQKSQMHLRAELNRVYPVLCERKLRFSWLLPYDHLWQVWDGQGDPIEWFQYRFQRNLFPP